MKKSLIFIALAFAAVSASAQISSPAKAASLVTPDSLTAADKEVNRRFLNKGTTLLNMAGGIPEPVMLRKRPSSEQQRSNIPSPEKLITRNLLFTGKLSDHISRPFIYKD
jgi:hypothetical protein